jgi:hypothetical protein
MTNTTILILDDFAANIAVDMKHAACAHNAPVLYVGPHSKTAGAETI